MGSTFGSGSTNNFYPPPSQPPMSNSMPSGSPYSIHAPPDDFVRAHGPTGQFASPMFTPSFPVFQPPPQQFYPNQPQPGGDLIVPPPPMVMTQTGEMVPTTSPKSKGKGK